MSDAVALSVHDTVPVWQGESAADALRHSVELAQTVDELGYQRYWVAEHHSTPALATSAPAVLAGPILAATRTIRVGSGVVLLPNHPPLVIAEQFGVLASLYPDRVDLGIGRAAGGSPVASARMGDPRRQDFETALGELVGYFAAAGTGVGGVRAVPEPAVAPQFWLVGSSPGSAQFAGSLGLPYVYAHAIVPGHAEQVLEAYRQAFQPSSQLSEPHACVSAIVVVADTDEQAMRQANPFVLGQIRMRTVDPNTVLPSEAEAAAHRYSPEEDAFRRERLDPQLIGSPQTVGPKLRELVGSCGADELFALTQVPDHNARIRSYELLSKLAASL